jgi:AraC family transcriptional activator of pobA
VCLTAQYKSLVENTIAQNNPLALKHFSVGYYAALLNVDATQLNKATENVLDVSADRLVQDSIIYFAKSLLSQPEKTIEEIASQLGFREASAFREYFQKYTARTPARYRQDKVLY